jgi:hypothetical protein
MRASSAAEPMKISSPWITGEPSSVCVAEERIGAGSGTVHCSTGGASKVAGGVGESS